MAGAALDIILILHHDGTIRSTDWHVVFTEDAQRQAPREVFIRIEMNGLAVDSIRLRPVWGLPSEMLADGQGDANEQQQEKSKPRSKAESHEGGGSKRESGSPGREALPPALLTPPEALLRELVASGKVVYGHNEIAFVMAGGSEGEARVTAGLYLWHAKSSLVAFDIDGTVTTSDIAGQVGQFFGIPLIHTGICEFACHLRARGYHLFFLTSRPLTGPAGIERTRNFLFHVARDADSGFALPRAPIFTTPHTSTWGALNDELVRKASGTFKLGVLRQIVRCFEAPGMSCVLSGGFGNRAKDAIAYLGAGADPSRVFLIDSSSKLCQWVGSKLEEDHSAAATGPAAAAAQAVEAEPSAPRGRSWQGYIDLLSEIDDIFPRICSEAEQLQVLSRDAALAAQKLPSGATRAYSLERGSAAGSASGGVTASP